MKAFIYGLYDPGKPEVVMVVGKTVRTLSQRLAGYVSKVGYELSKSRKLSSAHKWVNDLLIAGIRPGIRILETCKNKNWRSREKRSISIWQKRNPKLRNSHSGGAGADIKGIKYICECGEKRVCRKSGRWFCKSCTHRYNVSHKVREKQKQHAEKYGKLHKQELTLYRHEYSKRLEVVLKEKLRHHKRYHVKRGVRYDSCKFCKRIKSDGPVELHGDPSG